MQPDAGEALAMWCTSEATRMVQEMRVADGSGGRTHLWQVAMMTLDWPDLDDDLDHFGSHAKT